MMSKASVLTPERITELALANGFKLKTQPDGMEALNPYVFDFARAILAAHEAKQRADMFWNEDDNEKCHNSIHEMLSSVWEDGYLDPGAEFTVQQAIKLANVKVRVTSWDEDGDVEYEVIQPA